MPILFCSFILVEKIEDTKANGICYEERKKGRISDVHNIDVKLKISIYVKVCFIQQNKTFIDL